MYGGIFLMKFCKRFIHEVYKLNSIVLVSETLVTVTRVIPTFLVAINRT
ncbi:hypothetical protein C8R32_11068 [Nitrosospira sp. Nsp5]|uniref:Uncharacterized protein n=1 Tax=Nitrosospira multiformis TaxID=1231 RepID=A0ABY0TC55_9PROT|nr:hypothetical protein C8R32_11068 [Nitrosospira sp. Nsp5]SDQ37052.1 hypothetical protein SAMN05216402_0591 [Nitrosospira multiformis]